MTMQWLTAVGLMIAAGLSAWIWRRFVQARRQVLVSHFISLDRIAAAAGVDRRRVWFGNIHKMGVVKYSVAIGADIHGNRRGKLERHMMLDGSADYRAIEQSIGEHIREALSR